MTTKPFSNPYNKYTMFDNATLDIIMPRLSGNGWKVLSCCIRQTWGWADTESPTGRKTRDTISYSQFKEKTGIKSNTTISRALSECIDNGYMLRYRVGTHRGMKTPIYAYALNTDFELCTDVDNPSPENEPTKVISPENGLAISPENEPLSVHNMDIQNKKETKQNDGDDTIENDDLLDSLVMTGVYPNVARELIKTRNENLIRAWLDYAEKHAARLENVPGFLVAKIREAQMPMIKRERKSTILSCVCGRSALLKSELCPVCGKCFDCCRCDD